MWSWRKWAHGATCSMSIWRSAARTLPTCRSGWPWPKCWARAVASILPAPINPHYWCGPDPKNITEEFIDATVENCRHVIDAVKPTRTKFSIEMMPFNFPTGPDDYLKLIKKVDRKGFGVHLDVCNVMNCPERMYNNGAVIDECFRKLGPWIVSCHAKDLSWEDYVQVSLREVIPGRGQIDYRAYLRGLSGLPVDAPLMLEHLKTAEEYDEGRHHIQSVAREMGLSFGAEGA